MSVNTVLGPENRLHRALGFDVKRTHNSSSEGLTDMGAEAIRISGKLLGPVT